MRTEGHNVAFIDMEAVLDAPVTILSQGTERNVIFFIDNAQNLAEKCNPHTSLVKVAIQSRGNGGCYAFSPVVCDPHGSSVVKAGICPISSVYFTPFTETEMEMFVSSNSTVLP